MHSSAWPDLQLPGWGATRDTLHMKCQVVGNIKLAASPFLNQWWEVAFQLTGRGLRTGLVPWQGRSFEAAFDLREHRLQVDVSDGSGGSVDLAHGSVAEFHAEVGAVLARAGIALVASPGPSEVPDPVPFAEQTAPGGYDPQAVEAWWRAMLSVERVIQRFRTPFHGKSSPIHLFWGALDLNHSRFNGKPHQPPDGVGPILRYGENAENFAAGFWPGIGSDPTAVLYAYMTPMPPGTEALPVRPAGAGWSPEMSEFVFPYDALRAEHDPDQALLEFFTSTYEGTAALAGWDRDALEGDLPEPVPGYRL